MKIIVKEAQQRFVKFLYLTAVVSQTLQSFLQTVRYDWYNYIFEYPTPITKVKRAKLRIVDGLGKPLTDIKFLFAMVKACVFVSTPSPLTTVSIPAICSDEQFTCKYNHSCVSKSKVCNGEYDCSDKSDEESCASSPMTTPPTPKTPGTVKKKLTN